MTTRKLKYQRYQMLKKDLEENAKYNPSDECYNITINIDKTDYILKLQLVEENRILLWNVLEIDVSCEEKDESSYRLITNEKVLSSMIDILLWQKNIMFYK